MKEYISQPVYEIEPTDRHKEVFQYHNSSRQWEENENNVEKDEFNSLDQYNYPSVKKYDMHIKQPPLHRQRKVSISIKI